MNLQSDNISIFPAARRYDKAEESRLFKEKSVITLINNLIDSDGFVITSTIASEGPFQFNVYGYYICINNLSNLTSSFADKDNIYAVLDIDNEDNNYPELLGDNELIGDNQSQYAGISFVDTVPTGENIHYLKILEKKDDSWEIPTDSKIKFNANSINIKINGGEI